MSFTVPIYQRKDDGELSWTTLGLGRHNLTVGGHGALKIQRALVAELKKRIAALAPLELERFHVPRGIRLERVRLELVLRGPKKRRVTGLFPLVLEPRWTTEKERMLVAYHPLRQEEWFSADEGAPLDEQAGAFFQRAWAELDDTEVEALETDEKDLIKSVSFSARPKMLLDRLPDRPKGLWDDLVADPTKDGGAPEPEEGSQLRVLPKIGTNLTFAAVEGTLPTGLARSPYREQLQVLLAGPTKRSTIVVGPPGSGKTTIVHRLIQDRLEADDYPTHKNLDRIHEVWRISGKRIIAGMSFVGDWEQRCIDLLEDAKKKRVIFYVEDLHAFGRIGQARHSDRSLADFFRGPLDRGELAIIGECTPEQLQKLEDDAPSFAALFARVHVPATTSSETLRMMIDESRALEQRFDVVFDPFTFRTVLELGGSLFPSAAFPGKALDLVRELAQRVEGASDDLGPRRITPEDVIGTLAQKTGLPELLLEPTERLDPAQVAKELEKGVMGQPAAIQAAVDLVVRIKAGLGDPLRPYGVYLFTGPTGTGKTELATSIASYLYGDTSRLLRFDMSEFGGWDASARLIGDRFSPEGLLTQAVRDQPFSVVLFDEIEKAHPAVLNLLLQLFDEGRLTDAKGNTADFRHAVVIMTSNLGAKDRAAVGFEGSPDAVLFDIAREVRDFFPPELFNRIDRIVPFKPLSTAVARKIAEKELSRMVARRGLAGRSIFVYANEAVFERIVREAFDPKDGARPVKRWVEQKLGGLLVRELVKLEGRPTLQIFRIFDAGGTFRLYADRLVEAEPRHSTSALEPMLELPAAALKKHLPVALDFVRRLLTSDRLATLGDALRAQLSEYNLGNRANEDVIYNLESLRQRLLEIRDGTELLLESHETDDLELVEVEQFGYLEEASEDGKERQRLFDRRSMQPKVKQLLKDQMLGVLAEVYFLERALSLVHDPAQHNVFIELLRVGRARRVQRPRREVATESQPLIEALAEAYLSGRGTLESWAVQLAEGEVVSGTVGDEPSFSGAELIVLRVRGLCVLELFGDEEGSHLARSLQTGTELVRVRVWPAPPEVEPAAIIAAHQGARRTFERALERGDAELPPNPEALLPAVRTLRFEPPEREGAAPLVEVEDYVLGYSTRARVRSLAEILDRLWLLRMSRRVAEGTAVPVRTGTGEVTP